MKRTLCLLLGLVAGSAVAAPSRSWIEVSYGELEPGSGYAFSEDGDGDEARLAAAYATSATGYVRVDFVRQARGRDLMPLDVGDEVFPATISGPATVVGPDTVFNVDEWRMERERDIDTLTAGLKSPLNSGVDLIGEIGVARVRYATPYLAATSTTPGIADDVTLGSDVTEETGAVGRLGLMAEDGGVAWGATMEWYNKMPTGTLGETDSARFWNAYVGYRITPNWLISLRYADTREFETKGVSLRWSL